MKVNSEIIRGILGGMFNDEEPIYYHGKRFSSVVSKLTVGLNDLIARGDSMEHLKAKQAKIDAAHVEATGEIEAEMARIQEECPHFSRHERPIKESSMWSILVCDICGKILDKEMFDDIQ